jgi:hypothetical protein
MFVIYQPIFNIKSLQSVKYSKGKATGNIIPVNAMTAQLHLFSTSVLDEASGQLQMKVNLIHLPLLQGNNPQYPLNRRPSVYQSQSGCLQKGKNSLAPARNLTKIPQLSTL